VYPRSGAINSGAELSFRRNFSNKLPRTMRFSVSEVGGMRSDLYPIRKEEVARAAVLSKSVTSRLIEINWQAGVG
jgi:hypothetical protein